MCVLFLTVLQQVREAGFAFTKAKVTLSQQTLHMLAHLTLSLLALLFYQEYKLGFSLRNSSSQDLL